MTLIHASDKDISKQALRASRALDIGVDSVEDSSTLLENFDPLSFYYAGIVENRLLSAYIERRDKKPSRPKWWNFWLAKRTVKKELKNLEFPKEYLILPKLANLLETKYTLSVLEELAARSALKLNEDKQDIAETLPESENLIVEEPRITESSAGELSESVEAEDESASYPIQENTVLENSFTEQQLEQLARLLEENALLREKLEETQEKLESVLNAETSKVDSAEKAEAAEALEDSPEATIRDGEETLSSGVEENAEVSDGNNNDPAKPIRPGREAIPTWSELNSVIREDSISIIGSGDEDNRDRQNADAELDRDGLEAINNATKPISNAEVVDKDSTAKEVSTAALGESITEDPEEAAIAGLVEPPEEGFLYEDAIIDTPDENPFADLEVEAISESPDYGRQIIVEKLVVQQQVTEQSPAMSQQQPTAPVSPSEHAEDASYPFTPVQPPSGAPQRAQEASSEISGAVYPQRPALPVYRPSAPAAQEPVFENTYTEENTSAEEFVLPRSTNSAQGAPPQPQTEGRSDSTKETSTPAEDSVKDYTPNPLVPQPVAEEPIRERQTIRADMDVTASSVNINTKSGDPLADFDPSRYLNLANSMNKAKEEETVEEPDAEVAEENNVLEENSSSYLLNEREDLSDTEKVNAMLKELKQLRSSGGGGLV